VLRHNPPSDPKQHRQSRDEAATYPDHSFRNRGDRFLT
jgi:hypothetical protein